jgi:hypothetical protein
VFVLNKQEAAKQASQKKMQSIAVCIIFASDLVYRAIRKTKGIYHSFFDFLPRLKPEKFPLFRLCFFQRIEKCKRNFLHL